MGLFKKIVLKNSIEIEATPDRIWGFFLNIEENYKAWHPEDHILFRWTKGKPLEMGSTLYAEEVFHGKVHKIKATCTEVVPKRKFVFKPVFPQSYMCPRLEYSIEPKGSNSVFTAIVRLRLGRLGLLFARRMIDAGLKDGERHMREEGENLKEFLESNAK